MIFNFIFRRRTFFMALWAFLISSISAYAQDAAEVPLVKAAGVPELGVGWVIGAVVLLIAIIAGFLSYMFVLQTRFFDACKEKDQMGLFFQAPAGLPVGTIRAVISLMIITISLCFIVLQSFRGLTVPETLTAILGTIIGFYFGGRTAGKDSDQVLSDQMKELKGERDEAVVKKDTAQASEQASEILNKTRKGIDLIKTVTTFLPEDTRKKYDATIAKLEQAVSLGEKFSKMGNVTEAVAKAKEAFEDFKADNPVRNIVDKANQSFGRVLGVTLSQMAIITAVVGVSIKLVGVAYEKWKARILHKPFSPTTIPLGVVDANTGFVLFLKSPIFKVAFIKQLDENDRDFMKSAVDEFLKQTDMEVLWTKYRGSFESREQFEEGLEQFRHAAIDVELKNVIVPQWMAEAGGYDTLIPALDKIYADPESQADLNALVMVVEGLQSKGEPVSSIFDKTIKEVSNHEQA